MESSGVLRGRQGLYGDCDVCNDQADQLGFEQGNAYFPFGVYARDEHLPYRNPYHAEPTILGFPPYQNPYKEVTGDGGLGYPPYQNPYHQFDWGALEAGIAGLLIGIPVGVAALLILAPELAAVGISRGTAYGLSSIKLPF